MKVIHHHSELLGNQIHCQSREGVSIVGGLEQFLDGDSGFVGTAIEDGLRPVVNFSADSRLYFFAGNYTLKAAIFAAGAGFLKGVVSGDVAKFAYIAVLAVDNMAITDIGPAD